MKRVAVSLIGRSFPRRATGSPHGGTCFLNVFFQVRVFRGWSGSTRVEGTRMLENCCVLRHVCRQKGISSVSDCEIPVPLSQNQRSTSQMQNWGWLRICSFPMRLLDGLNNFNAAITGLFDSRHSPPKMTLTGLNLKSRKARTALFHRVSAPPLKKLSTPIPGKLNYIIDLAASGS